jgi:hypothetical protein
LEKYNRKKELEMKTFNFEIEGIEVLVTPSIHANLRLIERDITGYQVSGALMMMGEDILDMKNGHEFIIVDEELDAAYVFAIHADKTGDICIDVITVVDSKDIWNKRGTQILRLK